MIVSFVLTTFWKVGAAAENDLCNGSIAENDQNEASQELRKWISHRVSDSTPKILSGVFLEIQLVLFVLSGILVDRSTYFAMSIELLDLDRRL